MTAAAPGEIENAGDLAFHRRAWMVERVGWAVLTLVVLGAVGGLFGRGPLSRTTAGAGALTVEYDRFARRDAIHTIRVHLGPAATARREVRLAVDRRYVEGLTIHTIQPLPVGAEAGGDRVVYRFDVSEPGRPTALTFEVEPEDMGIRGAWFAVPGVPPARFRQIVYP